MTNEIRALLAEVFEIPINKISDNASIENVEEWDSMNHMRLLQAIETKYSISLTEEEMLSLTSLQKIEACLRSKK